MYDGRVVFEIDAETKHFDNQIESVKNDLEDLLNRYDETRAMKPFKGKQEDLREYGVEIEKTTNKLKSLKLQQEAVARTSFKKSLASIKNINMMDNATYNKSYALQYGVLGNSISKIKGDLPYVANGFKDIGTKAKDAGNQTIEAGKQAENSGKLFSNGFGKGLKSVKKLAMGIIGIRGAYMLARRAASAYMAEDTELTEKMNQAWFNLGAFLEPFLSFVADAMLKLTGYLNEFIEALTGTDYLARANAKALQKQTNEQNKLNAAMDKYQQYDFDVIRTQSSTGSGTGGYGESGLGSAYGEMPELNQNLVKGIQNLAGALKDLIDLITFKDIREGIEELDEASSIALDTATGLADTIGATVDLLVNNPDMKTPKQLEKADDDFQLLTEHFEDYVDLMKSAETQYNKMTFGGLFDNVLGTGWGSREKEQVKEYKRALQGQIYGLIGVGKDGRLDQKGAETLYKLYKKYPDVLNDVKDVTDKYKFSIDDVKQALGEYAKEYPTTFAQITGFRTKTIEEYEAVGRLMGQLYRGEISISEYTDKMAHIPEIIETQVTTKGIMRESRFIANYVKNAIEHIPDEKTTKIKTTGIIEAGKNVTSYVTSVLNKIPKEETTTAKFDDKKAKEDTTNYKNNLLQLPNTVLTTIKATLDTSAADWQFQQFKQKVTQFPVVGGMLDKLFSVMGFAGGGYISQPTLAMVGEGKYNEYVIPEGEDYISRLANEIGKYGSGGGVTNVYLDGRLIQRQVSKTANQVSFTRNGR